MRASSSPPVRASYPNGRQAGRDKIPQIIRDSGAEPVVRVANAAPIEDDTAGELVVESARLLDGTNGIASVNDAQVAGNLQAILVDGPPGGRRDGRSAIMHELCWTGPGSVSSPFGTAVVGGRISSVASSMPDEHADLCLVQRVLAAPRPVVPLAGLSPPALAEPQQDLRGVGLELLAAGRVVVLTLAGGRSMRMGGRFRGDLVIGPVTGRTLLELQGQRVAAVRRRFAPGLRWLIMVSDPTYEPVLRALRRAEWFGLPEDDVRLFRQRSLPVCDNGFQPVRQADGTLLSCPTGNGGMLAALANADLLSTLNGVDQLFVFQYPNALERVCDPALLGYHHHSRHDVTIKVAGGTRRGEQVGRVALRDGRLLVIEYHFLPDNGPIVALPFYTGTAVWSLDFLRRCWESGQQPPYRAIGHTEPGFPSPMRKVEQVLHELLWYADSIGALRVDRDAEYACVKRPDGPDSLVAAQAALTRQYRNWLNEARAYPRGPITRLEISPGYALSAEDVAANLSAGISYADGLVLTDMSSKA